MYVPTISPFGIGSIISGIGGAIGGAITGGIPGAIAGGVAGLTGGGGGAVSNPPPYSGPSPFHVLPPTGPGGATGVGYGMGGPGSTQGVSIGGPGGLVIGSSQSGGSLRGYHIAKSGKNKGKWVKNRRMNYGNSRALRRAIRREDGFVRLAKRALKHTAYEVKRRGSGRSAPRRSREEVIAVRA